MRAVWLNKSRSQPAWVPAVAPSRFTSLHWKNFLQCVRTREKPVSDVEFALKVQAALNMSMLAFLNKKVAQFDVANRKILI